jgi:endogenous inhibitor of DNA gyrase (YacG/DUF329 family)
VQANCPKCAHKVVVDDAKAPDRAFTVKCPKCQTPVKFAGKAAPAAGAPAAEAAVAPGAPAAPAAGATQSEDMRAGMMAQLRREMGLMPGVDTVSMRALVALADAGPAAAIAQSLGRQGYSVDTFDDSGEAVRQVEQGVYSVVVTSRATAAAGQRDAAAAHRPPEPGGAPAPVPRPGGGRLQDRRRDPGLRGHGRPGRERA